MGLRQSTDRGRAEPRPDPLTIAARLDQVTDDLLARVCEARTRGALRAVEVDCRRCQFDEGLVDRVFAAAGGKVVLNL